ncbi:glycosyl transferase family protein [Algibacillus agarilyticus]|uniref:glycosyl transferase family protein n=1 Tax=Algibacillus agarilyticus TaxID=2234133 RepID=UPI000DD0AF6C|nr:glycosyl transferase family protein [Algibacillus agarilyticus]
MAELFKNYIKAVGKGHKSGRYLTQSEAQDAMLQMLQQKATPEQVGALLMLLRVREESVEELAGFLTAARQCVDSDIAALDCIDLDIGCYAGKRRHLPWFILAVKALSQQGYRVLLHGTAEPESQRLYLKTVFEALNWPIAQNAQDIEQHIKATGFAYVDLKTIHPSLDALIQMRSLFGLRSCANTLARMLNPTQAPFSYHGVYHRDFDQRHAEVAALLVDKNVSCIRGEGGEVEINPERSVNVHIARDGEQTVAEIPTQLSQWQIKPRELSPEDLLVFWQKTDQDSTDCYAYAAVTATMASMLILIEGLNVEDALVKAKAIWHNRTIN